VIPERLRLARQYLDDAQYLLAADRLASAVSRAHYAAYQAMWAALGDPPRADGWRHGAIINHFVRGYWFAPAHPATGPGLLEALRFGLRRLYDLRLNVDDDALPISRASAEAAIQTVHQTLAAIDQHTPGGPL
jgi:uncharacterized protein (UPF0332 family)